MQIVKPLSQAQIEQIHSASEDILQNVGLRVEHEGLLRRLRAAGARVDQSGNVRIPATLLGELLEQVPSSYTIRQLDGTEDVVRIGSRYWIGHCSQPQMIDGDTQTPRRLCLDDVRRCNVLAQKLDAVKCIYAQRMPVPEDSAAAPGLRAFEEYVLNNGKHMFMFGTSMELLEHYMSVGRIISSSTGVPLEKMITASCPILSPLRVLEFYGEFLLRCCEAGFAICGTICPMAGATGPYSLAGNLLLANAENLFVAAVTQIVRPGNPFLYMFSPSSINMRNGKNLFYSMDRDVWRSALGQMAKHYNVPFINDCGGSMSPRYDMQAGAESLAAMLVGYSSEPAWVGGLGCFYNALGFSAEMVLIHTAWLEAASFLEEGMSFDGGRLGLESIKRVGPGGNFVTDELTLELLHQREFFSSDLFDLTAGVDGTPIHQRARRRVDAIVSQFESPLPGDVQEKLRRYFRDASA